MTTLDYMDDTYCFDGEATAIAVESDDKGQHLILDRTIFYPQGGGQETDLGTVEIDGSSTAITFVGFSNGKVLHYGDFSNAGEVDGKKVALHVDGERRIRNAASHTGGHLVAGILDSPSAKFDLHATKGFHFANGSYVEFDGEKPEPLEDVLAQTNSQLAKMIADDVPIVAETISYEELQKRCRIVPPFLPKDKPLRIVTIGNLEPLPCGGTHLASTGELSKIEITKIKAKKGKVRASYSCALN